MSVLRIPLRACHEAPRCFQYHVQVVVAGVVVTKALFWAELVTVFGLLVTDLGPGCYDHFNYDHLDVVPMLEPSNARQACQTSNMVHSDPVRKLRAAPVA